MDRGEYPKNFSPSKDVLPRTSTTMFGGRMWHAAKHPTKHKLPLLFILTLVGIVMITTIHRPERGTFYELVASEHTLVWSTVSWVTDLSRPFTPSERPRNIIFEGSDFDLIMEQLNIAELRSTRRFALSEPRRIALSITETIPVTDGIRQTGRLDKEIIVIIYAESGIMDVRRIERMPGSYRSRNSFYRFDGLDVSRLMELLFN